MALTLVQSGNRKQLAWHIVHRYATCGHGGSILNKRDFRETEVTGGDFPWRSLHQAERTFDPWNICSVCLANLRRWESEVPERRSR
jgi:hypothetical protein